MRVKAPLSAVLLFQVSLAEAPAGFGGFVDPNVRTDPFPNEVWMDLAQFFVKFDQK